MLYCLCISLEIIISPIFLDEAIPANHLKNSVTGRHCGAIQRGFGAPSLRVRERERERKRERKREREREGDEREKERGKVGERDAEIEGEKDRERKEEGERKK